MVVLSVSAHLLCRSTFHVLPNVCHIPHIESWIQIARIYMRNVKEMDHYSAEIFKVRIIKQLLLFW